MAVELSISEGDEFGVFRREGKDKKELLGITAPISIKIDLKPPAEGERLEIVRKSDKEFDTISLT